MVYFTKKEGKNMIKVDIISGFLGAGKTTLIKKLMQESFMHEKVVLIENEFGEIGIDGSFLKDVGIEIKEMNSGCICCSLVGDFSEALTKVIEQYHPDRIIIEPSGVGKLSDVMQAILSLHNHDITLNALVSVVDGQKCRVYMKNFGEFFNNQVEYAKTIIITRTEKITDFQKEECMDLLRQINDKAILITTPIDKLKGDYILQIMEESPSLEKQLTMEAEICPTCGHHHSDEHHDCCHEHEEHHHECCHEHNEEHHHECCHEHEDHHHADEIFTSIALETIRKYSKEQLEKILSTLSTTLDMGSILRAKGILASDKEDTWLYFDLVPGEYEIRDGKPDFTGRICVIGANLEEEKIATLFGVK